MSMPDGDLVIDVQAEAPLAKAAPEEVKVDTAEQESAVDNLKKQLETLREAEAAKNAELASVKSQATESARVAKTAQGELEKLNKALGERDVAVLDNAIAAAQAEADGYQRDQQAAFEAGDFAKASEFGRKMAKAEARVSQLESGKADLEYRKAQESAPKPQDDGAGKTAPSDPFEAVVGRLTPRTAKWFRDQKQAGRDFVNDASLNRKAQIAHLKAMDEGHIIDSDAYFDFCETELGLKTKPNGAVANGAERRAKSIPGAPVSRGDTPSGGQLSSTQVVLTAGEQRAATDGTIKWNHTDEKTGAVKGQPIGVKEYARRKLEMQKEGRYDRAYTDQ